MQYCTTFNANRNIRFILLFPPYNGKPRWIILALPNIVHWWRLHGSKCKMCTAVAVSLSAYCRISSLFSVIYNPVPSVHQFTNVPIYSLLFNSADNLQHLLYIHHILCTFSIKLLHYGKLFHLSLIQLPTMMIGNGCYSAVAVVWTVYIKHSVCVSVIRLGSTQKSHQRI